MSTKAKQTTKREASKRSAQDWTAGEPVMREVNVLVPYAGNPKDHPKEQVDALARFITEVGFRFPIAIDEHDVIIAGHGRLLAAKQLGMASVPCIRHVGLDETKKRALRIADNRIAEMATTNIKNLADELSAIASSSFDTSMVGFDDKQLARLLTSTQSNEGVASGVDSVPDVKKSVVTKLGDVWLLGNHRLVCGDCRDASVVESVCGGLLVNLAFTSPPYASQRAYDKSSGFEKIDADSYVDWFEPVQANVASHLATDGSWFVNIKSYSAVLDTSLYVIDLVAAHVRRWGWHFATEFCWERAGMPGLPALRFKNQFEPVYQFARARWKFRPDAVRHESDSVRTYSRDNQWSHGLANVAGETAQGWVHGVQSGLAYPGNRIAAFSSEGSNSHPAVFPVALPSFFVKAYTDSGDVVLDPFAGSGTTLIASDLLGRTALCVELSPAYCDVIVERWQSQTGKKATRSR